MSNFVRPGFENSTFYVGPEVCQTTAYSKKTLFVVGEQPITKIKSMVDEYKTPHVFLGANRSFDSSTNPYWESTVRTLLNDGRFVSLEYPSSFHESLLNVLGEDIWKCRNFIPVLSVQIPKVSLSSVNLTVKIDDSNFNDTNPGVWCMNHQELTDSNRFTSWDELNTDVDVSVVKVELQTAPMPTTKTIPQKVTPREIQEQAPKELPAILNNTELGLDPTATTSLKTDEVIAESLLQAGIIATEEKMVSVNTDAASIPEPNVEPVAKATNKVIKTPKDAAAAYTEGTTTDPLGETESKKPKAKK